MNRLNTNSLQRVIVTGAGRGIGNDIYKHLAQTRAVLPVFRTRRQLLESCDLPGLHAVQGIHGDLRNSKTATKIADFCNRNGVTPCAIIHCPGPIVYSKEVIPGWETWRNQYRDNLAPAILLIRSLSGLMQGGRIILFGFSGNSVAHGFKSIAAYAAAKESLLVFARSLAKKLAPENITVNVIAPGVFVTETGEVPEKGSVMLPSIPLGRFGQAADINGVVDWLLSPESSYVTGQLIKVSGGLHIS